MNETRILRLVRDRVQKGYTVDQIAASLVFHGLAERKEADGTVRNILKDMGYSMNYERGKNGKI